ncbi:YDG domain-containing protein [Flavobacterium aquicola]|uniref:Ig-like domain-containing protein n=1 Tax=Flavobacterium aquicola TaxID=1682742 RepID=A0A3E0DYN3_9FLAO|nr:YDG domain-containing protein [Flavobacterium aquicola]REG91197.1 hypothetical protein C8P67_11793 [Flavobacterium aquicola]
MRLKLLFAFLLLILLQTSGFGQSCNVVKNGDFTGGATGWTLQTNTTGWYYEATYAKDKIYMDKDGVTVSLKQTVNGLLGGAITLSFEITGQNADRLMCGTFATLDVKIGGFTYMKITNPANNATITTSDIIVYGAGTTYSASGFPITVGGTGTGTGGGKPGIDADKLTPGTITLTIPSWTGAATADLEFLAATSSITATSGTPCNGTTGGDDWILDDIKLISSVDPTAYDISGTSVCGGTATIGLSSSQIGVSYQLQRNGTNVGTLVAGTGSAIASTAFGNQTIVGTYTVVAIVGSTNCKVMNGSVSINALPTVTSATGSTKTYTGTANTTTVSATANTGETIDWYANLSGGSALVSGTTTTTTTYAPGGINAGTYTVYAQARNTTTGCISTSRTPVVLTITQLPVILAGTRAYDGTTNASSTDLTISNKAVGDDLTLSGIGILAAKDVGTRAISAPAIPVRVQSKVGNSGTGATSFNVTVTAPVNGNTLVAVISTRGTTAGRVTSITQTGAIWTRATQAANAGGTTTEIWYAPNVSGAETLVTINQVASLRSAAVVMEYSGILMVSPLDAIGNSSNATNNIAASTGTTPTTTQANEVLIGGIGLVSSGYTFGTPTNSFTAVANDASTHTTPSNNARVYALERIVSGTGAYSSGATIGTSSRWSGAIATFKAVLPSGTALTLGGSAAGNYTLSGLSGSMIITPKALSIAAPLIAPKVYDGSAVSGTVSAGALSGFVGTETVTVTAAAGLYADVNAGSGKTATVTYTLGDGTNGGLASNYSLTGTGTGNITKAVLTITPGNQTVSYGTPVGTVTGAGSYTPTGFVNSETSAVMGGSASYTTTYTATTAAGTSGVTITPVVTSLTAANYSFSTANGTITISKANSTITATGSTSFTYSGLVQGPATSSVSGSTGAVTYSYSGTGATSFGPSLTRPINAGTYQVIASVAADTNYNAVSSAALAFTINTASLTITANDQSKCYGTSLTLGGVAFSATGLQSGETITSVTLASIGGYDASTTQLPGSYTGNIVPSTPTGAGFSASNYAITFVGGSLKINALPNNISNGFSATTICAGGSPQLTYNAENNSTYTSPYIITYSNGTNQYTKEITNASAFSFTPEGASLTINTPYTLISISNGNSCIRTSSFGDDGANLIVRPIPTATITGTTSVCAGASSPNITFTNPQTVSVTVTYKINGGSDQTINIGVGASNISTVAVSTASSGTFIYNLVSVVYQDTPACPNTITGQSATVTVNALPSITAQPPTDSTICEGDGTSFTVAGSGAGLTYQWQLSTNGGGIFNNLSNSGVYSNVTAATMNITAAAIGMNNYQYRCIVSGTCAPSVTSDQVKLHVNSDSGSISLNGGTPIVTNGFVDYCPTNLATFSILPVSAATSYVWVVPAGWKDESGNVITGLISTAVPKLKVITGTNAQSGDVFVTAANISGSMFCPSHIKVNLTSIAPSSTITISKIDPTCAIPTGTVTASLPSPSVIGTLTYTLIKTDVIPEVTVAQNSGGTFTGLAVGDYVVTFQINSGCYSARSNSVTIVPQSTNTWNGTALGWSAGTPTLNDFVIFNADYSEAVSVNSCSCTINSGRDVIIPSGKVLTVVNDLNVDGTLTFKNGASLIQKNENPNPSTLKIVYERTTSAVKDFDYVYWSSPVAGQKLGVLSPLSEKYWSWSNYYWIAAAAGDTMIEGNGYIALVPRYVTSQTVKFIGTPNNGDITIVAQGNNKSNLIGNPYPSAINAEKFMLDNQSIIPFGGMLAFWTHTTKRKLNGSETQYEYESDDYAFFNISGGTGTEPTNIGSASGGSAPDGKVAAGQSFMVTSETANKNVFKFTNSMRIGDDGKNSHFFKQTNAKKTAEIEKNRIWLNLTNSGGAFKQLLVGYIAGATNDEDKLFDGTSRNSNAYVDFYSVMNEKKYTIQGRGLPFDETDEVPLGYKSTIEGTLQISIDKTDGFLANQAVYLEDKTANLIHDLTKGSYSFVTSKGEFKDRFVLRYTDTKLGTGDFDSKGKGVIVSVKNAQIKINSFDKALSSVKIYDLKGSLLYEKNKVNKNEFIVDHFVSSNQFMIVTVQLEDGKWVTEEIIFHD